MFWAHAWSESAEVNIMHFKTRYKKRMETIAICARHCFLGSKEPRNCLFVFVSPSNKILAKLLLFLKKKRTSQLVSERAR